MGIISRKRTRRRTSGLATATAYLAAARLAHAFVPQTSSSTTTKNTHVPTPFGGGSGSQDRLHGSNDASIAQHMVASRPRLGEDIFVGNSDMQPARRPRRTNNANSSASNRRRRPQTKRNNSDGSRQQRNTNRNHLPALDKDHVSHALHEKIAQILRKFDDMSGQLASPGSADGRSALAKAMTILSQAVDVIDSHMKSENANDATSIHFDSESDQIIHTEWLVHYASKVVRSFLQIERTLDLDLPDHPNLGGDANDPLYQANALLERLEEYCSEVLPWIDSAGSVLSTSYLRERIYNHVIGAYTKRAKVVGRTSEDMAREFVQIAESIVERMAGEKGGLVGPDAKSYGLVLSAHARCTGGAEAAANLLERMETRYNTAKTEGNDPKAHPRPNVVCYNAVMNAYARAGRPTPLSCWSGWKPMKSRPTS